MTSPGYTDRSLAGLNRLGTLIGHLSRTHIRSAVNAQALQSPQAWQMTADMYVSR